MKVPEKERQHFLLFIKSEISEFNLRYRKPFEWNWRKTSWVPVQCLSHRI